MSTPAGEESLRRVGRIVRPHGVRGELVIEPSTDSPDVRFAVDAVLLVTLRSGERRRMTITAARPHSGRLLVCLAGLTDRTVAEDLRGAQLFADVSDLPPTDDPDEFYDHELEGLAVSTVTGEAVGTLLEVLHGPGGELLVVATPEGGETLVPFVREIVVEVDPKAGRIVLDPPPGLLGEDADAEDA
jgi:16S rRNA processing protein RimM